MRSALIRLVPLCVLLLAVVSLGCGDAGGAGLPVSGTVSVDGQPLSKGSIAYHPEADNPSKHIPSGLIENGKYTLYTNKQPGAPAGKYKVTVVAQEEIDSTKPDAPKNLVDPSFADPKKTVLKAEVTASPKEGAYDFRISK